MSKLLLAAIVCLTISSSLVTARVANTTESPAPNRPKSCGEIQRSATNPLELNNSLTYDIYPFGPEGEKVQTRCDFTTNGGGWTIFQLRSNDQGTDDEFYRDWVDYDQGFGSTQENYWVGLKTVHALTSPASNPSQTLRIEIENWWDNRADATYSGFHVSNASDFYRLSLSSFDGGSAGDSLFWYYMEHLVSNNQQFTTRDADHDSYPENCATDLSRHGGWWFNGCGMSNLNGRNKGQWGKFGIYWHTWGETADSFRRTAMKFRDADFTSTF